MSEHYNKNCSLENRLQFFVDCGGDYQDSGRTLDSVMEPLENKGKTKTQSKPDGSKKGADLSQDISRQQGVIPYMPSVPQVYNKSYGKFIYCNDNGAPCSFKKQRGLIKLLIQIIERQQAGPSGQHHGPVGVSPE